MINVIKAPILNSFKAQLDTFRLTTAIAHAELSKLPQLKLYHYHIIIIKLSLRLVRI